MTYRTSRYVFGTSLIAKELAMIKTLGASALVLAFLWAGISMAAQPTPVPNTPPDFTSMRFLLGTWSCHQTLPGRPGDRTETDTYTMAYDGWQMQDHNVSPPFDKFRTRDLVGDSWVTWDPTLKLWITQNVDNFGGYGLLTSSGWVGNRITWNAINPDGTVGRTIETKVSDTKETFASWYNDKKGQPLKVGLSQTCKKS
jgi:hypothetical protein